MKRPLLTAIFFALVLAALALILPPFHVYGQTTVPHVGITARAATTQHIAPLLAGANLAFTVNNAPSATRSAVVSLYGPDGKLIKSILQGRQPYEWPGRDKAAPTLPPGSYRAEIALCADAAGSKVLVIVKVQLAIDAPAPRPSTAPATKPATNPVGPPINPVITRTLKGANRPLFIVRSELDPPAGTVLNVFDWGDGSPTVKGGPQAHVYNNAGTYNAGVTYLDKTGKALAIQPIRVLVPEDTRPVVMVDTWEQLKAEANKPEQQVFTRPAEMVYKGDVNVATSSFVNAMPTRFDWQARDAKGKIAVAPFFKGNSDSVVLGGVYQCTARASALGQDQKPYLYKSVGNSAFIGGIAGEGIWYGLNANNHPDRVLLEHAGTDSATAIAGYFAWIEASNIVVNFCRVPNVTNEHVLRVGEGSHDITVYGNRFSNIDRHAMNPSDIAKSTICIHAPHGDHVWVVDNDCGLGPPASTQPVYGGPMGIGPLPGLDGATKAGAPNAMLTDTVVWGNTIYSDSTGGLIIDHGTERLLVANNHIVTRRTPAVLIEPIETTVWDALTRKVATALTLPQNRRSFYRSDTNDYRHVQDVEITADNVLKREDGGKVISIGAGATNITVPGR
jgi:hypothetical protein